MSENNPIEKQYKSHPDVIVCIPVFNDWESVLLLIEQIDSVAQSLNEKVSVVLVNDGSTDPVPPSSRIKSLKAVVRVEIIHLRLNVGHQRAIALGLTYIYLNRPCQAVVVMDGDGEDAPENIIDLIAHCKKNFSQKIIFARRARRTEGLFFKIGYLAFKTLHYLLTGKMVEVGNFSIIPFGFLERLVGISDLWNHYAAAVFNARLPIDKVPINRTKRLAGQSKMNFTSLVIHGMSAISVYSAIVGIRLLCVIFVLELIAFSGLLAIVYIKVFTELAIPGWATNAAGAFVIILLILLLFMIIVVLVMLQGRNQAIFLPIRDWQYFVSRSEALYE
jgi:glycosyltransferase involved in cell wall biosynthesis